MTWQFIDDKGTFRLENPHQTSYLYFPLVNEAGLMSVVTPTLHGDIKTGQNSFLNIPVSVEDLHLSRAGRNFWVQVAGEPPWSAVGNSVRQIANPDQDQVHVEAGLLWHRLVRRNESLGLTAVTTNFVPVNDDTVELMQVELRNEGETPLTLTATAAIPLYGRSADNLRDHRHVTSLLHRVWTSQHGVWLRPTLVFDERGHHQNETTYAVLGVTGDGAAPVSFFPVLEDFIGEGGTLDWPGAVVDPGCEGVDAGYRIDGYEALGGLRFAPVTLPPGGVWRCGLILAIGADLDEAELVARYGRFDQFAAHLAANKRHWQERLNVLQVETGDADYDNWLRWVKLQPILRRLFGNSFLPYHDYGRGGRGWRDLWQDLLVLLFMEPEQVRPLLFSNFAGVRIDGSNATIIGSRPGEFIADRNNIPRVWMDHGAWPWLTTLLYLNLSGDLPFLLAEQTYFQDQFTHRAARKADDYQPSQPPLLLTRQGEPYRGTVLEHLLVQHLTAFFNVGEHNTLRLEGADWNDGLDMAPERGESVAFSALYATNLQQMADLTLALAERGEADVSLAAELSVLLDTLDAPVAYGDVAAKQTRLQRYFDQCGTAVSGDQISVTLKDLARDLQRKADWLTNHIRQQEWIETAAGDGWFNSYYDNDGQRVDGEQLNGVRMNLAGQVFTLMGEIATDEQARRLIDAAKTHLWDRAMGGYRLNSDYGAMLLNLGRLFGFAYGHKENGAMFTHMAVMYGNALYQRGFVNEGDELLQTIYTHSSDFVTSRMYPGLPEYINPRGRGMYPFLTGSASWYLLTLITEVWGINGRLGDLTLTPRLRAAQFDADNQSVLATRFAGRTVQVVYQNPQGLDYGAYRIAAVYLNGAVVPQWGAGKTAVVERQKLLAAPADEPVLVNLILGSG